MNLVKPSASGLSRVSLASEMMTNLDDTSSAFSSRQCIGIPGKQVTDIEHNPNTYRKSNDELQHVAALYASSNLSEEQGWAAAYRSKAEHRSRFDLPSGLKALTLQLSLHCRTVCRHGVCPDSTTVVQRAHHWGARRAGCIASTKFPPAQRGGRCCRPSRCPTACRGHILNDPSPAQCIMTYRGRGDPCDRSPRQRTETASSMLPRSVAANPYQIIFIEAPKERSGCERKLTCNSKGSYLKPIGYACISLAVSAFTAKFSL